MEVFDQLPYSICCLIWPNENRSVDFLGQYAYPKHAACVPYARLHRYKSLRLAEATYRYRIKHTDCRDFVYMVYKDVGHAVCTRQLLCWHNARM